MYIDHVGRHIVFDSQTVDNKRLIVTPFFDQWCGVSLCYCFLFDVM
jgi:hypothetical protein